MRALKHLRRNSALTIRQATLQGDTLADPYRHGYPPERIMRTPAMMGVI